MSKCKVYCDDCTYWSTVGAEIGFGCECRLHYRVSSPIRENDLGKQYDPRVENADNACPGYSPTLFKRAVDFLSRLFGRKAVPNE